MRSDLVIFAHLSEVDTDTVVAHLVRGNLWDWSDMVYDVCSSLLMTTTDQSKAVVMGVLQKRGLLPEGETILVS